MRKGLLTSVAFVAFTFLTAELSNVAFGQC